MNKTTPQQIKISARTPRRVEAARRYREAVKDKDEATRLAVDRIVRLFVCPDEKKESTHEP